jgi:hypothetical protein
VKATSSPPSPSRAPWRTLVFPLVLILEEEIEWEEENENEEENEERACRGLKESSPSLHEPV